MIVRLLLSLLTWTLTADNFVTMPKGVGNDAQGNVIFTFPNQSSEADYFYTTQVPGQIAGTLSASFSIAPVTSGGKGQPPSGPPIWFLAEPFGCGDPSVHLFVWARHLGWGDFDRWWSTESVVLGPGSFTLEVSLEPESWVSVWRSGSAFPAEFTAAMQDVSAIGLTFGGSLCDFGHGVYVTQGPARFILSSFTIS